jgi:hypothetical protein
VIVVMIVLVARPFTTAVKPPAQLTDAGGVYVKVPSDRSDSVAVEGLSEPVNSDTPLAPVLPPSRPLEASVTDSVWPARQ